MKLKEAISLIQTEDIKHESPETWADLGSGSGLFTQALSSYLADDSLIYAIDKKLSSSKVKSLRDEVSIKQLSGNFETDSVDLSNLDGVLMANSLHYVKDKITFFKMVQSWFRNKPLFLIVEYDRDDPNPWVPYPLSFLKLKDLLTGLGYKEIKKLHEIKSIYSTGKMYSALIR